MKHSKRMLAVVAAAGLAMGTLPGVANAQEGSEGLLDLDLGLNVGDSVEVGVEVGLGSLGIDGPIDPEQFPDLAGSLDDAIGATGSEDLDTGSEALDDDVIGDLIDAGSENGGGSGSLNGDSLEPRTGSGSNGDTGDDPDSSLEDPFGSLENIFDGLSLGELSTESATGSDEEDSNDSSLEDIFSGSLEGSNDGTEDSDPADSGSLGSLTAGSLDGNGSLGSADDPTEDNDGEGDNGEGGNDEAEEENGNGSTEIDAGVILAVGSLAAAGIAAGVAVSGGIDLPPLPEVNIGAVCNLPPVAVDFLKDNGSMERSECEPEEQN